MNKKELSVTLNRKDIIKIAEILDKHNPGNPIGLAFLEYCLFHAIREIKQIDFYHPRGTES